MLESTKLAIEAAKLQKKIAQLPEVRTDDPEMEKRLGEFTSMKDEYIKIQEKQIQALEKEDQEAQAAMARFADTSGWTPELRELRDVAQRTSIADYVAAAVEERNVTGAAKEYSDHVFGTYSPGDYPLEMLLDRDELFELDPEQMRALRPDAPEMRTVISGIAATHGNPTFVDRLLATSDAAYCMARFPAVGPGRHSYPIVTGKTVATALARNTAETASGGLSITDADPERIQHSYEYAAADELQIPGVANGLASDLRLSLMSGLDNKVIDDLIAGLTKSIDTDDPVTLAGMFTAWAAAVDGVGARTVNDVRWLVGTTTTNATTQPATYPTVLGGSIANVTHAFLAIPHERFRGSSHIAATTGGSQNGIAIRTGTDAPRLIVPVWRRGTLLRDTGRLQLSGQITLTGVMYADVIVVNGDQHVLAEIDTV